MYLQHYTRILKLKDEPMFKAIKSQLKKKLNLHNILYAWNSKSIRGKMKIGGS